MVFSLFLFIVGQNTEYKPDHIVKKNFLRDIYDLVFICYCIFIIISKIYNKFPGKNIQVILKQK